MEPLDLVHIDLMSFMVFSFSRDKYALMFINEFSCHSWVYILKYKSDLLYTFNTFKDFVEQKSFLSINNLYT
jgi:hypothetical protein